MPSSAERGKAVRSDTKQRILRARAGSLLNRRPDMARTAVLAAVDALAMLASFEIARVLRAESSRPFAHYVSDTRYTITLLLSVPLWLMVFAICRLYRVPLRQGRVSEVGHVIAGVGISGMILITVDYLSFSDALFPSRGIPIIAMCVAVIIVTAGRQLVRFVFRAAFRHGMGRRRVLLVGSGPTAARIYDDLSRPDSGYHVVGVVNTAGTIGRDLGTAEVYPDMESAVLALVARPGYVDEIVQADLALPPEAAADLISFANSGGIALRFIPDHYGVYAAASRLTSIDGIPVMDLRLTALDGWGAVGKRLFDLLGSAVLFFFAAPVLAVVAAALKVTEPSAPVFYRQERLGRDGKPIHVLKFRTMQWKYSTGPDREYATAEEAFRAMGRQDLVDEFRRTHKVTDDPRVTRLGALLRKTSIDELPQLVNSLRGDLSLVGPRPITKEELARYGSHERTFLALRPGITGMWQVYGRSNTTYDERVKFDTYYVENWSLGMDISILIRTILAVLSGRGAV